MHARVGVHVNGFIHMCTWACAFVKMSACLMVLCSLVSASCCLHKYCMPAQVLDIRVNALHLVRAQGADITVNEVPINVTYMHGWSSTTSGRFFNIDIFTTSWLYSM